MTCPSTRSLFLALAGIALSMASDHGRAQQADQPSPPLQLRLERELVVVDPAAGERPALFARAQQMEGSVGERIVLKGDAEVRRVGSVLRGDTITYTQATDEVNVVGNARLFRDGTVFTGPRLDFKIDAQTGAMPDVEFSYAPRQGRGEASLIEFLGNQRARISEARFTTCAPGDEAWWIQAERIVIDNFDESVDARSARLYFKGVPIFASPFLGFPLGDRRRSGVLTPSFGLSSTLGTDVRVPIYWNIAPNRDYTITPRLMSKRGVLLENEFRYLEPSFRGTITYHVIPRDRRFGESRDFVSTQHDYTSPSGFGAGINYNRVSDDNFFVDFANTIVGTSQKVLPQDAYLSYSQPYWSSALRVTKNQTLQDPLAPISKPYERVPQATLNGYIADWRGFEAGLIADGTRFDHPTMETGNRYYTDARISYPVLAPGWFVVPKARMSFTQYELDRQHRSQNHATRTLPILSLDTGLVFDRDIRWFGRSAQQTLEPRLFYTYIPYRDQSNLPNFDSALAELNYAQLFSENIYSGYDRIAEANQLTFALTTRVIDAETGAERLRAAIGQRYYFSPQRVTLPGETPRTGKSTDVLAAVSAQLGLSWATDFALQYSAERGEVARAAIGARWQPRRASAISAYYRYRVDDISQIDIAGQWPIARRWYAVGRYNYSLKDRRPIDVVAGFEYQQDCWLLRFAAQRFATATQTTTTNVFIQLELHGLTSVGTNALSFLQRNIPGYQRLNPVPTQPGRFDYYE